MVKKELATTKEKEQKIIEVASNIRGYYLDYEKLMHKEISKALGVCAFYRFYGKSVTLVLNGYENDVRLFIKLFGNMNDECNTLGAQTVQGMKGSALTRNEKLVQKRSIILQYVSGELKKLEKVEGMEKKIEAIRADQVKRGLTFKPCNISTSSAGAGNTTFNMEGDTTASLEGEGDLMQEVTATK